eukprot:Sspe_Gene.101022::Locus_75651_Transcript_1_2_Confidence_0.286_Length_612::g.101022::m.101022
MSSTADEGTDRYAELLETVTALKSQLAAAREQQKATQAELQDQLLTLKNKLRLTEVQWAQRCNQQVNEIRRLNAELDLVRQDASVEMAYAMELRRKYAILLGLKGVSDNEARAEEASHDDLDSVSVSSGAVSASCPFSQSQKMPNTVKVAYRTEQLDDGVTESIPAGCPV